MTSEERALRIHAQFEAMDNATIGRAHAGRVPIPGCVASPHIAHAVQTITDEARPLARSV